MAGPRMAAWEDLAVVVHEGTGPYALFVHGFLSSRSHWMPNLGPLADVCRPVVVEQYGHGRATTVVDPARLTPRGYCEAFEEIRRNLRVDSWIVVGHSLGGALTLRYAIEHPDHVLSHVFTNSQSAFADEKWTADTVRASAMLAARLEGPKGREVLDSHPMHPSKGRRTPPRVRDALVVDFADHDPIGIALQMRHTLPTASVRDIAALNTRPALLTVGTDETDFVETARHVVDAMPHVEAVELDAGHNVNLHAVDEWNAAVADFIARHDGGDTA